MKENNLHARNLRVRPSAARQNIIVRFLCLPSVIAAFVFFLCFELYFSLDDLCSFFKRRSARTLTFNAERQFRITIFEDLHFGESKTPAPITHWLS